MKNSMKIVYTNRLISYNVRLLGKSGMTHVNKLVSRGNHKLQGVSLSKSPSYKL